MRITIVLPAYNEERDLPPLLERTVAALSPAGCEYRILVVDDGSSDRTADIVSDASASSPVVLVRHPRNMGLGAAIRTGLLEASREDGVVITMDADNSQDPSLIPLMVERLEEGYDVVIASRFQEGGEAVGVPAHRKLLSHAAAAIMGVLIRFPGVRDYTCGYRAYTSEVLRRLQRECDPEIVREDGFACMFELLVKLRKLGAKAAEVPLVLRYDLKQGASKMRVLRTGLRYAAVLWRDHIRQPAPGAGERVHESRTSD